MSKSAFVLFELIQQKMQKVLFELKHIKMIVG